MKKWKLALTVLADLFLTIFTIMAIIAFAQSYSLFPSPQMVTVFWQQFQQLFWSFFSIRDITVSLSQWHNAPLLSTMMEPYAYSLIILWGALAVSFLIAVTGAYICFLLPRPLQKMVKGIAFFLESIPDVIFIFSTQLFVIWVFKKTDLLIVNPVAGFDNVYVLPIVMISILPSILLFQMTFLAFTEEKDKPYVEYALAKGLSKTAVLWRHMFRNALITVFSNVQYLFWFMLSNLLVAEYLFNMHGFFRFLYEQLHTPEVVAIGLAMLFLPFYIIDVAGKRVIAYLTGIERGVA
ncbi:MULTISPECIES: ABC transporter permease subunit [Geobacillus]|uniref:ABC transporter permease subunit n=1 Tax=Geobacillus proteiniphilus TaxID=860353 RepID=A0ABY9MDD8_9BACL|nr:MULTISPECIES: ABC transporter permease subunit [Geobacillus]KDE50461.1 peptide ABC transporter permease [Geobacillus sp. CAMR5420]WMJ16040.1 ABC transporter permease subunit [Geobacillus proteiniphilus]